MTEQLVSICYKIMPFLTDMLSSKTEHPLTLHYMLEIIWMTAFLSNGLVEVDLQHSLPDLTPMDFFYWGYIKDIVYSTPVADLEDLSRRIVAACSTVTPEMLGNRWRVLECRLDICRGTRGAHIEIY